MCGMACLSLVLMAGCSAIGPTPSPTNIHFPVASQWHAQTPHGGETANLSQWWAQFDDPVLLGLIASAQLASPTLASALANIADAEASRVVSEATLRPAAGLVAAGDRGRADVSAPVTKSHSVGAQASWELDLFGANLAGARIAQARLEASQASWHDARVSVAVEVARHYIDLRACEAQMRRAEVDAWSRVQTSKITELSARAGIKPRMTADLAQASAAEGQSVLARSRAQCDLLIKSLVALTARNEVVLRRDLALSTGQLPTPRTIAVSSVPAEVLAQRPDILAAALDVVAADAAAVQAGAQRWPQISLTGNIRALRSESMGISTNGRVWSIGPVTLTLPIFDGGAAKARSESAKARHEAAKVIYSGRLRTAIQEVESALVTLESTAQRAANAGSVADLYERSFIAMAASYEAGAASLVDIEDARRSALTAQSALIDLRREQLIAWVALYRSSGGGWSQAVPPPDTAQSVTFGGIDPAQSRIADNSHRSLYDIWSGK